MLSKPIVQRQQHTLTLLGLDLHTIIIMVCLSVLNISTTTHAQDIQLRFLPEYKLGNNDSLFTLKKDNDQHEIRSELEWQRKQENWHLNAAIVTQNGEDIDSSVDVKLNEAFYEGELTGESEENSWDFSIGKKRLDWGIAWGFRPLDTLQKAPRQTIHPVMLQGVPHLSLERFGEKDTVSLIITSDIDWQGTDIQDAETSATLRLFRLDEDWEYFGLAAWGEKGQTQLGGGVSRVIGQQWKTYGELLYQHKYTRLQNSLLDTGGIIATGNPIQQIEQQDAVQTVIGAQWTGENKISALMEYAYDGRAYDDDDWQAIRDLATQQQAFIAQNPNALSATDAENLLTANRQIYNVQNLLQHNVFTRITYDGEKHDTAFEWLYTPEDKGSAFTLKIDNTLGKKQTLEVGLRHYAGGKQTALDNLAEQQIIFATFQGRW